jgi:heme/copper-type cytochrome/quinol oxidase subunit 2
MTNFLILADTPYFAQYGFQDPATTFFEKLIDFHHDMLFLMVVTLVLVFYILITSTTFFSQWAASVPPADVRYNTRIETIWTTAPTLTLMAVVIPAFSLIYAMDDNGVDGLVNIKISGNQWYWTYGFATYAENTTPVKPQSDWVEDHKRYATRVLSSVNAKNQADLNRAERAVNLKRVSPAVWRYMINNFAKNSDYFSKLSRYSVYLRFPSIKVKDYSSYINAGLTKIYKDTYLKPVQLLLRSFDSNMIADDEIKTFEKVRLLSVDRPLILPVGIPIRLSVSATDVIHSWAIPSFGVKLDACPGRTNTVTFTIKRQGLYYGQCSEICGSNHAFMPIQIKAVHLVDFNSILTYL